MKILMLSWEYPPLNCGGLAAHVEGLAESLAAQGVSVYLLTQGDGSALEREKKNGVEILRVSPVNNGNKNFLEEICNLNLRLLEKAFKLATEGVNFDQIHGHDWLVFQAARTLKYGLQKPLIYTIHATEAGRNHGLHNNLQHQIHSLEWQATYEAWKVIVCSNYMDHEVRSLFSLPEDKVVTIPNGVKVDDFIIKDEKNNHNYPEEKIIFYVGRLVREKGVQTLLRAAPRVLAHYPDTRFIIAGKGPYRSYLEDLAYRIGVGEKVLFKGYISDEERNSLYNEAETSVFPSLYEPFGIVALEAMAAGSPVIASRTGGLAEVVEDGKNGLLATPEDDEDLAEKIKAILRDPDLKEKLRKKGKKAVEEKYSWQQVAAQTNNIYKMVNKEYKKSLWYKKSRGGKK